MAGVVNGEQRLFRAASVHHQAGATASSVCWGHARTCFLKAGLYSGASAALRTLARYSMRCSLSPLRVGRAASSGSSFEVVQGPAGRLLAGCWQAAGMHARPPGRSGQHSHHDCGNPIYLVSAPAAMMRDLTPIRRSAVLSCLRCCRVLSVLPDS